MWPAQYVCFLTTAFVLVLVPKWAETTIDMNLAEMEYIADHLDPIECKELAAMLHFKGYSAPKDLGTAERKISDEIPCIRLLLHYNGEPGEGRGATHMDMEHRLRQLGREDLAEWLGKAVFHQLAHDLNDTLLGEGGLGDVVKNVTTAKPSQTTDEALREDPDPDTWTYMDSLSWTIIIIVLSCTFFITCRMIFIEIRNKHADKKISKNKRYNRLRNEDDIAE